MTALLRDVFNKKAVEGLSERVKSAYPQFDSHSFTEAAASDFASINYAERLEQITDALYNYLPKNYSETIGILIASATPPIEIDDKFKFRNEHFINLPLCRYVSKFGLEHFEESMNALKELTKSFTSEYDIRYFIEKHPKESIKIISEWANDSDPHIRRLASEGTRPRLPMGKRLHVFVKDPAPILPIIEKLKNDPVLYVRRSAANSLNDISKDHPDMAADIAAAWKDDGFEHSEWMCRHAMRTLLKKGHQKALATEGFLPPEMVDVWGMDIKNTTLNVGDTLEFSFFVENNSGNDMDFMVDFEILFVKANKKLSPKVFKHKRVHIRNGKKLKMFAKHQIKRMTTRKLYTGRHYVRIVVNGERYSATAFYLQA